MNNDEKEPFLELSRRDRERWLKDKALEKKPRDPNRPKRPPSAYFLFLADFRKSYPGKADPAKVRISYLHTAKLVKPSLEFHENISWKNLFENKANDSCADLV